MHTDHVECWESLWILPSSVSLTLDSGCFSNTAKSYVSRRIQRAHSKAKLHLCVLKNLRILSFYRYHSQNFWNIFCCRHTHLPCCHSRTVTNHTKNAENTNCTNWKTLLIECKMLPCLCLFTRNCRWICNSFPGLSHAKMALHNIPLNFLCEE